MNRRSVLAATVLISAPSIAGCNDSRPAGDTNTTDNPPTKERTDNNESPEEQVDTEDKETDYTKNEKDTSDPNYSWILVIYLSIDTPEDALILDAKADSLLEIDLLESALNQAVGEYEKGTESEFGPEDHLSYETQLAEVSLTSDQKSSIEDKLDLERQESDRIWYVKYQSAVYVAALTPPPEP